MVREVREGGEERMVRMMNHVIIVNRSETRQTFGAFGSDMRKASRK